MFRRIKHHHDFMWGFTLSLIRGLSRPAFVFLAFLSMTIILSASFFLYKMQPESNLGVSSFLDILYFVVTTITGVGFGDITPKTPFSKSVSMLLMLGGTALYVCFTATLATLIMDIEFSPDKRKSE